MVGPLRTQLGRPRQPWADKPGRTAGAWARGWSLQGGAGWRAAPGAALGVVLRKVEAAGKGKAAASAHTSCKDALGSGTSRTPFPRARTDLLWSLKIYWTQLCPLLSSFFPNLQTLGHDPYVEHEINLVDYKQH